MEEDLKNKQGQAAETTQKPEDMVQAKDGNGAPVTEKMPREVFYERIRAARPDGKYDEDEQEYYNQAGSLFDELESGNKRYKNLNEKLRKAFEADPEMAQAFLDYLDGKPLIAAIREHKGDEALTMQEGQDGWEDWQKADTDRKTRMSENMELAKTLKANAEKSEGAMNAFIKDKEMSDEEAQKFSDFVMADFRKFIVGDIDDEILNRYYRAMKYDSDVEGAREQGKVDGKNEAIEAKKAKMAGSGLPNGSAGGNASEEIEDDPRAELAKQFARFRRG